MIVRCKFMLLADFSTDTTTVPHTVGRSVRAFLHPTPKPQILHLQPTNLQPVSRECRACHTADYGPFIKSQLAQQAVNLKDFLMQIWSRHR